MLILIADDEVGIRKSLFEIFRENHEVVLCENGADAFSMIEKKNFDLVICDHHMPGMLGVALIKNGKKVSPHTVFILITAFGSLDNVMEAFRSGADDILIKPFHPEELLKRVERIDGFISWDLQRQLSHKESKKDLKQIIGQSKAIEEARSFVKKVAPVPSPVLLLGPSGSGKEILARAIHDCSPRHSHSFVAVNCANLKSELLESELFGHEKGAFTGATSSKPGKFELAKGGTIFLDEIGEMSTNLQASLLRVLENGEFCRVGGVRTIKCGARVIAATHRPIKEMVKKGKFRDDLFFRINVLSFQLPPLADRKEDIQPLVEHFWATLSQQLTKNVKISSQCMNVLLGYNYPGNVRELRNILERLIVMTPDGGTVSPEMLPSELSAARQSFKVPEGGLTEIVEKLEAQIISQTLTETGFNRQKAADILKISRGSLNYKIKMYQLGSESDSDSDSAAG